MRENRSLERRRGRDTLFILSMAALSCLTAGAQELGDGEVLFVSSEPFGAAIMVNGEPTGLATPAILRLAPGGVTLQLTRPGHEPATVQVDSGNRVHEFLPARYVTVETPEEATGDGTTLPLGEYRLERDGNLLLIAPQYEREELRTALQILFPVSLAAAAGMGAWSYFAPPEETALALWPAVAAQLVAAGIGTAAASLEIDRTRFLEAWQPPEEPYYPRAASRLRDEAAHALERGDIPGAVALYSRLRSDHPEAPGVPEALYTEGRLAALGEDGIRARELLLELVTRYPVLEYYDRALLQLARLASTDGDRAQTEAYLDRITYTDPSVTREEVNALRNLLLE